MVLRVPQVNPRLANITAPQLPRINILGAIESGLGQADRSRQIRQQEALQGTLQAQGPAALGGDIAALQQIALQGEDGAELAANLQSIVQSQNDQEFKVAQRELKKQGTFLASLINSDPDAQRRKIFDKANELLSEGDRKNGAEFLRISQLKDPLEIKGELQSALTLVTGGDKFLQSFLPQTGKGAIPKFIGTPQRVIRDGKAFLSGVVQDSAGNFGLEEVEVSGEFADVQGVTASQKAEQEGLIAKARAEGALSARAETPGGLRTEREAEQKQILQIDEARDNLSLANRLAATDLDLVFGRGESLIPTQLRSQQGQDLLADLDRLGSQLELAAAGKLKGQGQITESERKVLRESVSALKNRDISPEKAREELQRIIPTFQTVISNLGGGEVEAVADVETGITPEEFRRLTPAQQQAELRRLRGQ